MLRQIACALIATAVLAGCDKNKPGAAVTQYDRGSEPPMVVADRDGDYSLYSQYDPTAMVTYTLKRGEKLGFERGETGKIVAVAGNNRVALEDKSYTWKKRK